MSVSVGDRLGPYEILAPIGAGGMGEVYKARDTRLDRVVALKVSKTEFSQRFEREARAIAALNHPHICHLYDVGPNYLVMELVEGDTLKGPLPVDQVLTIAGQIADALDAAHEKNIVHRDLKPANIKITSDGVVKVLDFGLARAGGPEPELTSDSPTLLSQAGMILGTAAYMAPEQARGKLVDKRADIWAFGVVMYELLSGRQLFPGETITDVLASVLTKDPDLSAIPPRLRRLIGKCLEKDPKKRLRDIGDWTQLLDGASAHVAQTQSPAVSKLLWAAASIAALIAAALGFIHFREQPPAERVVRLSVPLPENSAVGFLELSPDARRLLLVLSHAGGVQAYVRSLDSGELKPLSGVTSARTPFWSPDSRFIAFFADDKLKVIPASGGPARVLCDETGVGRGGSWSRNGTILFSADRSMRRVDSRGGPCTDLSKPDSDSTSAFPVFMPDGKHYFYVRLSPNNLGGVYLAALEDPVGRRVLDDISSVVYTPPLSARERAHLLFLRESTLMAQPFDDSSLQPIGDPFPVASQASMGASAPRVAASASADGTLVYLAGLTREMQLTWFDRTGKQLGQLGSRADQRVPTISPDGNSVFAAQQHQDGVDVWLYDPAHGSSEIRLIPRENSPGPPVWSPDSSRLWLSMKGQQGYGIYTHDIRGSRQDLVLKLDPSHPPLVLSDMSRDGRFLVTTEQNPKTGADILYAPIVSGKLGAAVKFLATPARESQGQLSPDGKWLAYTSDESGRYEVYVRPFPGGSGVWRVSTDSGREPRWSSSGKELFFITGTQPGLQLMAALLAPDGRGGLRVGAPQRLFEYRSSTNLPQGNVWTYSPHPDGKRFLVNVTTADQPTVNVILHWQKAIGARD